MFIFDEIHQIFVKCVTSNMIRFTDFKAYEVPNILFMRKSQDFFKRINGFKRQMRAMKFKAFFRHRCLLYESMQSNTELNEAYEMRSRIAYCQVLWHRRNYTHTKAAVVYLLHTSNSQIRFLLNSISKFCNARLLAWK